MLLHQDKIPRTHNILAGFFTWILLAGFVLFPGTFSSLKNDSVPKLAGVAGEVEKNILGVIQNLPLFVVAFVCCGIGAVGMIYLWWRWSNNYVWLVNRIFICNTKTSPGTLNSLTGVISTLVNVYGAQHREFSTTSKITIIVTGASTLVCGAIALVYSLWKLQGVKRQHDKELGEERVDEDEPGCLGFLCNYGLLGRELSESMNMRGEPFNSSYTDINGGRGSSCDATTGVVARTMVKGSW
ncbi:hypothetical protein BD779DRAFT_1473841 [Infundibulicybe gibba]|nr:hypothetical protein BD779DRAFT_1473841 [Infundibulicybe gibba]